MDFAPGQRWHSLTEPELGLGLVEAVEGRQVVMAFPARDVVRRYATGDPPLARSRLTEGQQARGIARNLSRGGMFVEVGEPLSLNDEVQIHFPLPDTADRSSTLRTTAKVVWTRHGASRTSAGLGLQFLALDRASAERIEDFVYERSAGPPSPRPAAAPLSK